jgi:hypothetical protein
MQAILITAYKNPEQVRRLVDFFSSRHRVFVHIDAKSTFGKQDVLLAASDPRKLENVRVLKKWAIEWGSINHLYAVLELMRLALEDERVRYIHVISGEDIPTRPLVDFDAFDYDKHIYMSCASTRDLPQKVRDRYELGTAFPCKSSLKKSIRLANFIYGHAHVRRFSLGSYTDIRKGLIWASMPREAASYVLGRVASDESFMRSLGRTLVAEEFCFQTVLYNSEYRSLIHPNSIRYMDWAKRNGSIPAYLDESDYRLILERGTFFARKVSPVISHSLIELVSDFQSGRQ